MRSRIQNVNPTNYNNIHFRSKLEAETAKILDALGISYQYEPYTIELQESFRFRGELHRKIEYKPDFILDNNIIIECKGFETPEWKIKRKLLMHKIMVNGGILRFHETHSQKELFKVLDLYHDRFNIKIQCSNGIIYDTLSELLKDLKLENKITSVIKCILGKTNKVSNYTFKYSTGYEHPEDVRTPFKKIKS